MESMRANVESPAPPPSPLPQPVEWRVHPARRQPGRAVVAVGVALGTAVAAGMLFGSLSLALVSAGALLAAVGEFLFPTTYRLTAAGAEARNLFAWRRIAWKEVKRVYAGKEVIKLSPLKSRDDRREPFRGVLLRCENNQTAVLEVIDWFRNAATGARVDG